MNDNSTAAATASQRPSPSVPFEQRIFELSPLGSLPTAIAIFVLLVASFEACAVLSHYPLSEQLSFSPQEGAWPAIILSLLVAVALGMQRYASTKELEDGPALARVTSRDAWAGGTIDVGTPNALRWAGFAGSVCGFGISFLVVPPSVQPAHLAVFLWFAFAMAFAFALFARGLVTSLSVARDFADRLDRGLKIDLLRIDDLSVIGRAGARAALVWLSAAAVVSLFFVSGQAEDLAIATVVVSAGMALWIFFRSLEHTHRKIQDAKSAELDRVRSEINGLRLQAAHDHTAAVRLHGLVAYEARIASIHTWPFDELILLRVGAYVLIPAIPSLGQALMRYFMEHVAR